MRERPDKKTTSTAHEAPAGSDAHLRVRLYMLQAFLWRKEGRKEAGQEGGTQSAIGRDENWFSITNMS